MCRWITHLSILSLEYYHASHLSVATCQVWKYASWQILYVLQKMILHTRNAAQYSTIYQNISYAHFLLMWGSDASPLRLTLSKLRKCCQTNSICLVSWPLREPNFLVCYTKTQSTYQFFVIHLPKRHQTINHTHTWYYRGILLMWLWPRDLIPHSWLIQDILWV